MSQTQERKGELDCGSKLMPPFFFFPILPTLFSSNKPLFQKAFSAEAVLISSSFVAAAELLLLLLFWSIAGFFFFKEVFKSSGTVRVVKECRTPTELMYTTLKKQCWLCAVTKKKKAMHFRAQLAKLIR